MKDCNIEIHFNIMERKSNGVIYAALRDASDDSIIISAELTYILQAALDRQYNIINLQHQMMHLAANHTIKTIKGK